MWNNQEYESWDDSTKDETPRNINLNKSKKLFLKKVNNLPNLETIDLSYAGFVFIGELINNLHALTTLDISHKSGDIYDSSLRVDLFPESLEHLNMSHNNLNISMYFMDFQHLCNLHTLNLSHTGITYLPRCPASLRVLDVSSNSIHNSCQILTNSQIGVIANLHTLVIHGNVDIFLPDSIPLHILLF